jgi:hypothetical protein
MVALRCRKRSSIVKRYHYDSHRQIESLLHAFINACNYGRRLKALCGLIPKPAIHAGPL